MKFKQRYHSCNSEKKKKKKKERERERERNLQIIQTNKKNKTHFIRICKRKSSSFLDENNLIYYSKIKNIIKAGGNFKRELSRETILISRANKYLFKIVLRFLLGEHKFPSEKDIHFGRRV